MRRPAAALLVALAGPALAASFEDARLVPTPLGGRGLQETVEELRTASAGRTWIGWSVPAVDGYDGCCWSFRRRCCSLEGEPRGVSVHHPALALSSEMAVLLRVSDRSIDRVAAYSGSCPIEGGGATVHWIEGVPAKESLELLASLLADRDLEDESLAAIAFHADPGAGPLLERLARHDRNRDTREDALFWIAQRGDSGAADVLLEAAAGDDDPGVREHAVFAISQLPEDTGTLLLLGLARDRAYSAEVRRQAIFWLAQSDDPRALDLFSEILRGSG